MGFAEMLIMALAVSADAFAVGLTQGVGMRPFRWRRALLVAGFFGFFQALMPLIGWLLGSSVAEHIKDYDHWVTFGLLSLIGGRMIWQALTSADADEPQETRVSLRSLLVLSVATSIDALAVGISLAVISVNILQAVLTIGTITLVLTLLAVFLGHRVGRRLGTPAEIIGGAVLIGIGVRILLQHLGILG